MRMVHFLSRRTVVAIAVALASGCGETDSKTTKRGGEGRSAQSVNKNGPRKSAAGSPKVAEAPKATTPLLPQDHSNAAPTPDRGARTARPIVELASIDEDRLVAEGIRRLKGEHLTLYTDLPADAAIQSLPRLFDLAVPEWLAYFQTAPRGESGDAVQTAEGWRVRGFLMKDKERFTRAGLLPEDLPEFAHAYTRGNEIWWYDQDSDYYRAHLMLHEGTHSFMFARFGTCGPPWYSEGLAELLGTHRYDGGELTLGYFPARREQFLNWGRIKIVSDAVQADRSLGIDEILAYPPDAHLQNEPYGWCWAIAAFLDGHPRYRERFRQLTRELKARDFNAQMRQLFADDWSELNLEWQLFIREVEFGYDLERNAVEFRAAKPLGDSPQRVALAADRGWQSSGIRLAADTEYAITAAGRYQIAAEPKIWWCEPGGVTIRYYRGYPLGMLMALIMPDDAGATWPAPTPIGSSSTLRIGAAGTLYFKINDSPAELADNAGSLEVTLRIAD